MNPQRRYCIYRTDGIGDVLLTLPLAEAIRRHDSQAHITMCVRSPLSALVQLSPHIDSVYAVPTRDPQPLKPFITDFRRMAFDVAIFSYPRPGLAWMATRASIPIRVGTAHRWYSFLFNRRCPDHRRRAVYHESEYNLRMLDVLGIERQAVSFPSLVIDESIRKEAIDLLAALGVDPSSFFVLHPGSAGSAKDWPLDRFAALAETMQEEYRHVGILVTGTDAERPLCEKIRESTRQGVFILPHEVDLIMLAAILSLSKCVVANSTGPLHLAAAVGTPVVGLYPNLRVCSPRRWAPLAQTSIVLTPPIIPECTRCERDACDVHDRMEQITIERVADAVRTMFVGTENAVAVV